MKSRIVIHLVLVKPYHLAQNGNTQQSIVGKGFLLCYYWFETTKTISPNDDNSSKSRLAKKSINYAIRDVDLKVVKCYFFHMHPNYVEYLTKDRVIKHFAHVKVLGGWSVGRCPWHCFCCLCVCHTIVTASIEAMSLISDQHNLLHQNPCT